MTQELKQEFKKEHDKQINDQRSREAEWQVKHCPGYSVPEAYEK